MRKKHIVIGILFLALSFGVGFRMGKDHGRIAAIKHYEEIFSAVQSNVLKSGLVLKECMDTVEYLHNKKM